MKYGYLKNNIEKLLKERSISKNKICADLELSRGNFNKYCQNKFQRIDANFICKLCSYFECTLDDLFEYVPDNEKK